MLASTCLGGDGEDRATRVALDAASDAYVTGYSTSYPPEAPPSLVSQQLFTNAFVYKLDPSLRHQRYAAFLDGRGNTSAYAIAVDHAGSAYITGATAAPEFPATAWAFGTHPGKADGSVMKA